MERAQKVVGGIEEGDRERETRGDSVASDNVTLVEREKGRKCTWQPICPERQAEICTLLRLLDTSGLKLPPLFLLCLVLFLKLSSYSP